MLLRKSIRPVLLENIVKQVKHFPEFPYPDNNDWLVPDYLLFHKKRRLSFIARLRNKYFFSLTMRKKPLQLEYLAELLTLVADQREEDGYTGGSLLKMTTTDKSRFIILGDIHGALHSLVRIFTELKKQLILDESLKIINEDYTIIFLGDVIDRSAYSSETLILVLQLIAVNGDRVIYLRGNHEDRNMWQEYGFGRELGVRAKYLSSEKIPFTIALNRFFNTLPYALYLKTQSKFVRISHEREVSSFFNEENLWDFFAEDEGKLTKRLICDLKENVSDTNEVLLDGIICSESSDKVFRTTDGLKLLASEKGALVWSPFSSPIKNFQEIFGFYNDAFCLLDATQSVDRWILSLFKQDVRKLDGFSKKDFQFILGSEISSSSVQLTGEIVIGCSLDLSKTSRVAGKRLKNGIELRMNQENARGGIAGNRLKMVFLDDEYTPVLAMKNISKLLKTYKTDILLSPLGSPVTQALVPQVKEGKVNIFFPYTGLDELRDASLKGVFHYRAAYKNEIYALLDYAIGTLKLTRFALIYQEDAYGLGALAGAKEAFNSHGITEWLEAGYSRNTLNMDIAVSKTLEFNPQAIIFIATYAPAAAFVEKIGIPFLFNKLLMGVSFLTDLFRVFLKKKGFGFVITRVVPNFTHTTSIPLVQEYLNGNSDREEVSWDSLEGYINASIFIEALKNITAPITKEKISNYLENIHGTDLQGITLDFDPVIRGFSKDLIIDTGDELLPWSAKEIIKKGKSDE